MEILNLLYGTIIGVNIANMTIQKHSTILLDKNLLTLILMKNIVCKTCWNDTPSKFNMRVKFSTNSHVIKFTEAIMNGDET